MDLARSSVAQILIPVTDLERAVRFYRETLGLPFLFQAPPQMAFFQCGGLRLLVGVPPADQPRTRSATVYFRIADIQAVQAELARRGVAFSAAPHAVHKTPASELWLAEFSDPDGNNLALFEERPSRP
jgi:predicted enzyme related to lactoylglutathione lyase